MCVCFFVFLTQKRKLQWFGLLQECLAIIDQKKGSQVENVKQLQGGQKQRWHNLIQAALKKANLENVWREKAQNRKSWRNKTIQLFRFYNEEKE